MILTIDVKFKHGQIVYCKTDFEQLRMIVTGYLVEDCNIKYMCTINGDAQGLYFASELSTEIDEEYRDSIDFEQDDEFEL